MNGYLIPANAKRGTLIFNIFRPSDLMLFLIGIAISLIMLMVLPTGNLIATSIAIIPAAICSLLILPISNYHNVLCALCSIYNFYTKRKKYVWKGWGFYEQFKDK